MEHRLDAGRGSCALRKQVCAQAVADALRHGHGCEYDLGTFVIMPNHMHVLVVPRPGKDLADIVSTWEQVSARRVNRLTGRRGRLWAADAYDRILRDEKELRRIDAYIRQNPGKAALREERYILCGNIDGWEFLPGRNLVPGVVGHF
jgi:type I restriction enzyme R subunit